MKNSEAVSEARECPEMLSTISDPGLEVFQVTTDLSAEAHSPDKGEVRSAYSPDGKRLVFRRIRDINGSQPRTELTLCEIDNRFALLPLTHEEHVRGHVFSRDGRYVYYFVEESIDSERLKLLVKRIDLDNMTRETVIVVDGKVDGVGRAPRGIGFNNDLQANLSPDGTKISTSGPFFSNEELLYANLIFDIENMTVRGFVVEPHNWRPTGMYTGSTAPGHRTHMVMCYMHQRRIGTTGWNWEPSDDVGRQTAHIITDEGEEIASLPLGGIKGEGGPNHLAWRGPMYQVANHSSVFNTAPFWRGCVHLVEPIRTTLEHRFDGAAIPGAKRWDLTRHIKRPDCFHISFDPTGTRFVTEVEGVQGVGESNYIWIASVPDVPDPFLIPKYLLHPNSSAHSFPTQVKPSLTPDCRYVFFRSDWLCKRTHAQLFCATGFSFP